MKGLIEEYEKTRQSSKKLKNKNRYIERLHPSPLAKLSHYID